MGEALKGRVRRARRQAPWRSGRRRRLPVLLALFCALALLLPAGQAPAHEVRPLIATLEAEPEVLRLELSMNLEAAIAGVGPEHDDTSESPVADDYDGLRSLSPARLAERFAAFEPSLLGAVGLGAAGRDVPLVVRDVRIPEVGDTALPRLSLVTLAGAVPDGGADAVSWQLSPPLGDSVIRLRDPVSGEILAAKFVAAGESSGSLPLEGLLPQGTAEVLLSYLELGFIHIVPRGFDHILFVIGLFLLSTRLSALLWQVSAFTIAHTLTLALAATGAVSLPASVVEPLIAASIVWIGVENLMTDKLHRWRPMLVFAFGLLHGLGFAGVLGEIGLPPQHFLTALVAFNIGVELGQLAVIAACFLAVGWAMRAPGYRRLVSVPASLAISSVAVFWFVERMGVV